VGARISGDSTYRTFRPVPDEFRECFLADPLMLVNRVSDAFPQGQSHSGVIADGLVVRRPESGDGLQVVAICACPSKHRG
jgi:hypothetical protein